MKIKDITLSGNRPFGEPPGRIYCGSGGGESGLSDEHIVAYCLASGSYLPSASCEPCAKTTSYLEGYAGKHIFGQMRVHFGLQSRRKKIELAPLDVTFLTTTGEETRQIRRQDLPAAVLLPILPPPGLFHNQPPAPIIRHDIFTWTAETFEPAMKRFMRPTDVTWLLKFDINATVFARMLAKIAHAFTVASLGIDSFKPLLPNLILGKDQNAAWVIGGAAPPTKPSPRIPNTSKNTLHHVITLTLYSAPNAPSYVVMTIQLFQHIGTPTYYVIVGEALPPAIALLIESNDGPVP